MYLDLIPKIKELLEGTVLYTKENDEGEEKDVNPKVYPNPLDKGETPSSYPAIIFFPTNFNNEFASSDSNYKELNFSLIVIINAENISNEQLFTYTLPNAADKVIDELDKGYSFDRIDGKRVWARADVGTWGKEVGESGRYGFVNINLIIKLETKL